MGIFHLFTQNLTFHPSRRVRTAGRTPIWRWLWVWSLLPALVYLLCLQVGTAHAAPPVQTDSPLTTPVDRSPDGESGDEMPAQETSSEEADVQDNALGDRNGWGATVATRFSIDMGLAWVVAVLAVIVLVAAYQTWRPQ